jgi:acetylornithine deacetylase
MTNDPLGGQIREGRLWGRGATDAKGQAAALLHALAAVCASPTPPPYNIQLIFTIDEEVGFTGVRNLIERGFRVDAAVIGEPTELSVVVAHKGTRRWWIELGGRSAHSARPELGVNAIHQAARLVARIQEHYAGELARRSHPLLGSPTVNVSKIEGGTQVNLVPDSARILLDRRMLPGETSAGVEEEVQTLIRSLADQYPNFNARQIEPYMVDPPLETDPAHAIVRRACTLSGRFGRGEEPIGVPYGTDGSKLSEIGIPTIVVGPGSIAQAHTADEFIELDELHAGARYYFDLMQSDLLAEDP